MNRLLRILPFFLALLLLASPMLAKESDGKLDNARLAGTTQGSVTNRTLVNIGQVAMWIYADGTSSITPAGCSGLIFPRGSSPTTAAIFADGPVWGGIVNDGAEPALRVGGGTYSTGTVAGAILSAGNAEDFSDAQNVDRIWRVRRDFATATDAALRQDAAEQNTISASNVSGAQIQTVRDIYRQDWVDWPAHKGAPFYDADSNGVYSPEFNADGTPKLFPEADEPGVADADQVVWYVSNDLDAGAVQTLYGSPAIGMEVQGTLWAYSRSDALGQIVFKQFRFIYKGTSTTPQNATIDSLHFCQWSDPDLGSFGDDFVGSDIGLSLGYAYNASSNDATYASAGLPPPASGYDFFAGPLVEDAGSEAIFGLQKRAGFRNLPMTTFGFFAAGGQDSDPTRGGDYNGTLQWWNLLRGFRPRPEFPRTPWLDKAGNVTKFVLTGDPVAGTGDLDADPGDRRLLLASGPFTMGVGDTNETVVAVLAALGSDRLSSVAVLKFVDRFAQDAFDNLFELAKAPPVPLVKATELDGEILLNWGGNPAGVDATENFSDKGYTFEGYNVYQLPSSGASLDQGVRIATFDAINEVTVVSQEVFDQRSGLILEAPVQLGSNSGIRRLLTLDQDLIRDLGLINGQTYFFGVTAYNFNGDATVKSLESVPSIVTVVPQTTKLGERFQATAGDTIPAEHAGVSDGSVTVLVTDPTALTGDSYEVTFSVDTTGGGNAPVWHMRNTTTGEMVLEDQTNQTADSNYLPTQGFKAIVGGAPDGFKNFLMVANGAGPIDPFTGAAADFQGFPVPARPGDEQQVGSGHWFFHAGGGGGSLSEFIRRSLRGSNFSRVIPFDWEMRFTGESWASKAFLDGALLKVPFELWNIGSNTPDDASDDYRVIPWFLDSVQGGGIQTDPDGMTYQLDPNDHPASGGTNDPFTPWIYWRQPVDTSPGEAGYTAFISAIDTTLAFQAGVDGSGSYDFGSPELFGRTVLVNWNGDEVADGEVAPGTQLRPEDGSIIRIITTKPNTPNDSFTFSTAGFEPTVSNALAKQDAAEMVNVFPNPYMGVNSFEGTRFTRFLTFSHLPQQATIRIFNLAGIQVALLEKNDDTQFMNWDLQNENGLPVAGGIYVAHVEMPGIGATKDLKLVIVQEQQFLRNF